MLLSAALLLASQLHLPFPAQPLVAEALPGTGAFRPDSALLESLTSLEDVVLEGLWLPGEGEVDLALERVLVDYSTWGIQVDGAPFVFDPGDQTLWRGRVVGQPHSDVWLTLASVGCSGWIRTETQVHHVLPFVPEGGTWEQAAFRVVPDVAMRSLAPERTFACLADGVDRSLGGQGAALPGQTQMLEARIAVETDYQYYAHFGNLAAAQNFMTALLAAISYRYESAIDVILSYPYVQFWTSNNDPWDAQSGGTGAMLNQFQAAWAGNIPAQADLAHFVSGVSGGGLAYVGVLCNNQSGFAVSFGINGGVSFPVTQGGGTWDFVVIAHEIGHNFGTPHTHDYCPPLDRCAPGSYMGSCQGWQQCTSNGTVMSYCHLCSGGMNNITTYFHPIVRSTMRVGAESCLPPCPGCGSCTDDVLEPNDDCATAIPLAEGQTTLLGLRSEAGDPDFFVVDVPAGRTVTVDVTFDGQAGDVELRAFEGCLTQVASSNGNGSSESITWQNTGSSTQQLFLEIWLDELDGCTEYDLAVLAPGLGDRYCDPAVPNSTGLPGRLEATGQAWASAGDLTLRANQLPLGQFGYFLASQTPASVPQPGGSVGVLCVGGVIGRFTAQLGNTGSLGALELAVDLSSIPTTPVQAVQPGQTWCFQLWHRDQGPTGPISNFTDALAVTFL